MSHPAFSLAEVLLALSILAVVLVMAVTILHYSLYSERHNQFAGRALMLAQEKLAEVVRTRLGALEGPLAAGYTYRIDRQSGPDGLEALTVIVTGPENARASLHTYRRCPPRDVILTVRSENHWRLARAREEGGPRQLLPTTGGDDTQPTVSSDGRTVVFASTLGGLGLWVMPTDGSAEPRRCDGVPIGASAPCFSPDGRQIAFVAPDHEARSQLFLLTPGSGSRQVSHGNSAVSGPSWSPSGQLAVALDSSTVALMALSGSVTTVAEGTGWNSSPAFSPDGHWLAFMSNRDGNPELYRVHPDGSQLERLTDDPGYDVLPRWSADGRRLLFQSDRGGSQRIWSMNADGTDVRRLGRPQDEDSPAGNAPEASAVFLPLEL